MTRMCIPQNNQDDHKFPKILQDSTSKKPFTPPTASSRKMTQMVRSKGVVVCRRRDSCSTLFYIHHIPKIRRQPILTMKNMNISTIASKCDREDFTYLQYAGLFVRILMKSISYASTPDGWLPIISSFIYCSLHLSRPQIPAENTTRNTLKSFLVKYSCTFSLLVIVPPEVSVFFPFVLLQTVGDRANVLLNR